MNWLCLAFSLISWHRTLLKTTVSDIKKDRLLLRAVSSRQDDYYVKQRKLPTPLRLNISNEFLRSIRELAPNIKLLGHKTAVKLRKECTLDRPMFLLLLAYHIYVSFNDDRCLIILFFYFSVYIWHSLITYLKRRLQIC